MENPQFKPTLTINDKKRDCTACRRTLIPGATILKTFTKKGKPAGYFCSQAGHQLQKETVAELGYWEPAFLGGSCPDTYDKKYLPFTKTEEVPFG